MIRFYICAFFIYFDHWLQYVRYWFFRVMIDHVIEIRNGKENWKRNKEDNITTTWNYTKILRIRSNYELLNWNQNMTKWTIYIIRNLGSNESDSQFENSPFQDWIFLCVAGYMYFGFFSFGLIASKQRLKKFFFSTIFNDKRTLQNRNKKSLRNYFIVSTFLPKPNRIFLVICVFRKPK